MSDYTPTTEQITEAYSWSGHDCYVEANRLAKRAEFGRWLAQHDAEKRAEWEAEQGWEYGACYQGDNGRELLWFSMGGGGFAIREAAEREVERYADEQIQLCRRRKAGPWVPVNENGTADREVECAGVIEVPAEIQDALRARITPDMQAKQDAARERIRERNARLFGTDREVGGR